MKTIYFYLFLFYEKVLKLSNPRTMATLVLSACLASFINGIIELFLIIRYSKRMQLNQMIFIALAIIAINFFIFILARKQKQELLKKQNQNSLIIIYLR